MMKRINIIGAGNLGKTIGYLLAKQPETAVNGICNTGKQSTAEAIQFMGAGKSVSAIAKLPPADITFITTPDDQILSASIELSRNPHIGHQSIVLHCSGALSSDVLSALTEKGCLTAAIHPMKSFADPALSVLQFEGTYCALEGDAEALPTIKTLFEAMGAFVYEIDKRKKALYHAAGVFASNYLITLARQALDCMKKAGVAHETALPVIIKLMSSSLMNLENASCPQQALTGPLKRGDIAVIEAHLGAFRDKKQKSLYAALGKATLELTEHDPLFKTQLEEALNK